MVGQQTLLNEISSFDVGSMPHTILLVGESGCGKHTLANIISERVSLPLVDITDVLTYDLISEIQTSSNACAYSIDLDRLDERGQNVILKFAEEPSDNAYIIMMACSTQGILDTVLNRCYTMRFKPYSDDELREFSSDADILRYCSTPGQIKNVSNNLSDIRKLCDAMVTKMGKARFDNALSIANKLNFKDEYDKYDVSIFMNILLTTLADNCIISKNASALRMYDIVSETQSKMRDVRLNKRVLIEHMIVRLWGCARK